MIIHRAIILLLSWPCVSALETEKSQPSSAAEDIFDQIATASENLGLSFLDPADFTKSPKDSTTESNNVKVATIHYENSNGFVPITSTPPENRANATAQENAQSSSSSANSSAASSGLLEDDPAYSTEARMFLNLAGPSADRRSFDAPDGQNEFEILKVTNETPAIANYHQFYENVQNKLQRNRGTERGYAESADSNGGTTHAQNQRTKERIKKIEKYLTKFHGDQDTRDSVDARKHGYYSLGNAQQSSKTIFEPEKVTSSGNFNNQHSATNYDVYGDAPTTRQRASSLLRANNYDGSATSGATTRHKSHATSASAKNRHVNSKPVVVIEPSDFKLDMKYGADQAVAKVSSGDHHHQLHYRNQKLRDEPEEQAARSRYDLDSRVNREDRYGLSYDRNEDNNGDYSDEANDYLEVTEKPKKIHKNRRRLHGSETSRRLPKEHRAHASNNGDNNDDIDEPEVPRKHNSPSRSKLHRPKAKPSYWNEDDSSNPISEESSEEQQRNVKTTSSTKHEDNKSKKQTSSGKSVSNWSQIGPNIEVSHSNGFEIDQLNKPKLLVPVNLNLVPFSSFDHTSALGNSQGFDLSNVPNFVTATPIVSSSAPLLSTSQSVITPNIAHPSNAVKNIPNMLSNNYGMSTAVPDVIVGHNTYQNGVQTLLIPQMNLHNNDNNNNKYTSNMRTHFLSSTVAPMFTVTPASTQNVHNMNPTATGSMSLEHFSSTVSPRPASSQNVHHFTINPSAGPTAQPQFVLPQPTMQSFPVHNTYNGHAGYNILVNPHGLHGQNLIQHGNGVGGTTQTNSQSATTAPPSTVSNNNVRSSSNNSDRKKKTSSQNSDGHFLATASFAVGNGEHQQKNNNNNNNNNNGGNDNKYLTANNQHNSNNNYYNEYQNNNQQTLRSPHQQQQQNYYQIYGTNQNLNAKQTYQVPAIVQTAHGIPINFNHQNFANLAGQLQEQQSVVTPNIVVHRGRDQNQQILTAATDIFQNTWKQLQQLQTNEDSKNMQHYQNIYRVNDNLGSTSNLNSNTANLLPGLHQMKAHLPNLATQNVEILNPNIKPSPVDLTLINPYGHFNHYPTAVITTPIPIFSTPASFLTPRPVIANPEIQNYVNSLTQIGAHSNQINAVAPRPEAANQANQENQRQPLYNPINFVPNLDLMKSQSMLNSKIAEPLPHQLNLVPVIPGGNFFKNTYNAQSDLVHKPRLSSDLEKYAEEMFKESLKTIYSTHKWNNDKRTRANFTAAELNDLVKLKSELQRFKASLPDPNFSGKDILEAHQSETKVRTAEPSRTTKKPDLSIAAIEQLFKAAVKQNLPPPSESSQSNRHKNRGHSSSSDYRKNKPSELSDYLTPPKPNSFVSKSPFNDSPKPVKKRPGSPTRYNPNGNSRPRPGAVASRPSSGIEASASNHIDSAIHPNGPRYEKHKHRGSLYSRDKESHRYHSDYRADHQNFDNYQITFTTPSAPEDDLFKSTSSAEQSTKPENYFDINHPRTHNLLGLLMKNKQLPTGTAQSFFRDDDELRQYFDNEKRRAHLQFYEGNLKNYQNFQKKSDANSPIDMAPPAPPNGQQIQYYAGRHN